MDSDEGWIRVPGEEDVQVRIEIEGCLEAERREQR